MVRPEVRWACTLGNLSVGLATLIILVDVVDAAYKAGCPLNATFPEGPSTQSLGMWGLGNSIFSTGFG